MRPIRAATLLLAASCGALLLAASASVAQVLALGAVLGALLAVPDAPALQGRKRRGLSRNGALILALLVMARDAASARRDVRAGKRSSSMTHGDAGRGRGEARDRSVSLRGS